MPEDYGRERGGERGEDRDDRDRDRDRWDVKPEKPSKITMEAAEDVEGLLKVAWETARDVFKEKASPESAIMVYDRILNAREI